MNTKRKNPPIRAGKLITFQVDEEVKQEISDRANAEFPTVSSRGRVSALIRKALEIYLADLRSGKKV